MTGPEKRPGATGDRENFLVDLPKLDSVIRRMTTSERTLEDLTNEIEGHVANVQKQWDGLAADAQRLAHLEWEKGLRTMRDGLKVAREAAELAHENYNAAIVANLDMWEQTR